jgi:hypothetical protein
MAAQTQTMIYTVDLGNGNVADIEGPPGATAEQLHATLTAGGHEPAPVNDMAGDTADEAPIHFKSWGDVQDFRKHYPEKASLSDQEFVDWFGQSRQAGPQQVTVGDRNWKDYLGLGTRAVVKGLNDIRNTFAIANPAVAAGKAVEDATGLDPTTVMNRFGLAQPATDNEKLVSSGIEGVAATAPLLAVGGPVVAPLAAGAASGVAGEATRQAGYGPLTQFAASLIAGAPFAAAPAAARAYTTPLRMLTENIGDVGAEAKAARILQDTATRPIGDIVADIEGRAPSVSGAEPTLAEVAMDPALAGLQRGHANSDPAAAAALAERHNANAIARTRAASEAMGDGSPQAIQDLGAEEMTAAERATAEQQAARQADVDARLAGERESAAASRGEAGTGLTAAREGVGPPADRDATGASARQAFDDAYQAAKQKTREAYGAPVLKEPQPITIPQTVFAKLRDAADEFYGDGGGEIPGQLRWIIDDMADQHATTRTLTNIDRRLADFAGEARMAGRNAESAFAERVRGDLGDFVQRAAPQPYKDALRAAKAVRAEQGRVFETGDAAAAFARDKFGNPVHGDNALSGKLVRQGAAGGDTADRLIAAVGPEQAEAIVRQELRRVVEEKGVETAAQARALNVKYGETARRFPAVKADLDRIEQAAAAHDAALGIESEAIAAKPTPEEAAAIKERAALHEEILKSPLARVADPATDPSSFVGTLLGRNDGGRQFKFLTRQVRRSADAMAGLRRALGDYIIKAGETVKTTAAGDMVPGANPTRLAIARVVARAGDALTGQQRIVLKQVSRELEKANFAFNAARPAGSDTRMNRAIEQLAKMAPDDPIGATSALKRLLPIFDNGQDVKELLTQAMLDPDFAATLLKRQTEKHWTQVKAGMAKGRKTFAASAASHPLPANDVFGQLGSRFNQADHLSSPVAAEDKKDGRQNPPQQQGKPAGSNDPAYRQWLSATGVHEEPTYDTYAAFKAGLKPDTRGHLSDEYKLPNHPTFSTDSIHNGEGGHQGGVWIKTGGKTASMPEGTWTFRASPWNLQNMSKAELKAYFDHTEPGMTIIFPDGERYTGKAS